jgi:hypothetical protein
MKKTLAALATAVAAVAVVLALVLLGGAPSSVTHAQTSAAPVGLPPTGGFLSSSSPLLWVPLILAGVAVLAVGFYTMAKGISIRRNPIL